MGGYYSGRWHGYSRKITVEECRVLSVGAFNKALLVERYSGNVPVYESETEGAKRAWVIVDSLAEEFGWGESDLPEQAGQAFRVTRTPMNFGGYRYWLVCPGCRRRCGKLYKPYEGSKGYACRKCHDLSYISAQEAHRWDRLRSIRYLVRRVDQLNRAEKVQEKMAKARFGSKNWRRLNERYEQIMRRLRYLPDGSFL